MVVSDRIDTPFEFLVSSFKVVVVKVTGTPVVLIVVDLLFVGCFGFDFLSTGFVCEVVLEVVEGLLKMVNGLTFGLVNDGLEINVTGTDCYLGVVS